MVAMLFDGRALAKIMETRIGEEIATLPRPPRLVSVLVGDDPASALYTRLKQAAAERVGIDFLVEKIAVTSKQQLVNRISEIGASEDVTGVMVQMPIAGMSREEQIQVLEAIPLDKDVDGLRWRESQVMPATVAAILIILEQIASEIGKWKIEEKKIVVVGGTGAVGRPLVQYLSARYGVVAEVVNSKTRDIGGVTREAGVVISCVGKPGLVTPEMVGEGVVAIDVGISKVEGKVVGDMTRGVYEKARVAVPVPGGVGPVTVASLMQNALSLWYNAR